jgi:hypothetical protein
MSKFEWDLAQVTAAIVSILASLARETRHFGLSVQD